MRWTSWILLIITALAAGLYESVFAGSAPWPFFYIHPILPGALLLLLLNKQTPAYVFLAIGGMAVDLMSAVHSGFAVLRFLLVLILIDAVAETVITNKSLYAVLILMLIARLADFILFQLISKLSLIVLQNELSGESLIDVVYIVGFDIFLAGVMFVAFTLFTRRFLIPIPSVPKKYDF